MTSRNLAKLLAKRPAVLGVGKDSYVVIPMADYQKLRDAYEDAMDLLDLERARRETSSEQLVSWEDAKKRLPPGKSSQTRRPARSKNSAKSSRSA